MAQQADLKATHYIHQLQNALTRGLWADPSPAQAVKGEPMTWDELLRKYKKHCVSQHITAELALQTQSLSLLLLPDQVDAKRITQEDLDGDSEEPHGSMSLGTECELSPSRVDDARLGFAALELLNDTPNERDSTLFTRAYFAYALKRYKECLALLNPMSFDENPPVEESAPKPTRLQVPSEASTSSSTGTHLTWTGSIASVDVDVRDAKMWRLVEIIRGRCLQGMAMEQLDHPEDALGVYEATLPILQTLRLPHAPTSQSSTLDPSFVKYRELWRWAERLLWRASCLVSRFAPIDRALTVFRVYSNHAQYYPPTFRPNHRSVVASLYLYALLSTYPGSEQAIPGQTRLSWITEARTLLGEYRLVLAKCTVFPKAGDRNTKVEEYCDGVMAVWERAGSNGKEAQWAIEILWWATRMTFHSHRIFRHLVRLTHANGDGELVKRTMALYAQLVTKSRQASMSEVESTIRRRRTLDLDNDTTVMGDVESVEDSIGSDSDRQFVECLIFGARMLCRLPGDVEDIKVANGYLSSARDIVSQSTSLGRDNILRARLSCAGGVVELTLAHRDADPITRPQLMRSALNHLGSAVQLNPASSDAYYHLAIALIQAGPTRDVEASVQAAQHAVELDASDIRYWHLLGLVLSASGQHAQARKVLIIGEELELDGDMEGADETTAPTTSESVLEEKRSDSPTQLKTLIPAHHKLCPTPSKMLLPIPDHPQPSKEDIFEHGLQLRMTLLSLIELVDGAEVASVKWVEVFAWFAERGGWAQPHEERRASFDLPPIHTIPPSESGHETSEDEFYTRPIRSASASDLPAGGLPITIIPPPPKEQGDSESVHTVRLSSEKDEEHSISRTKKAQRILKEQVNKRQSQIQTISKKLGRNNTLRSQMSRASSTPDITLLAENSRLYQASSIHSRQRMSPRASYISTPQSPPPPRTPPAPALADIVEQRTERERRLICELWLTSAATFRRMGKLEQAREAIQEAEGIDEAHPGVWVQLGLYLVANGEATSAISAFHKALVINPDFIPAVVHLAQQYLKSGLGRTASGLASEEAESERGMVDLAAGMLSSFTKGPGWDVPEAWYLLANAVSLQGRKERERECLTYALGLVEGKPIRDIRLALDCAL